MDRAGQIVGNYRLVRLLGSGGFADVYLAEQRYLGTQAAIKLLHAHLAPNDVDPFLQEARTLARLQHPAIVRVLDFGVESSEPYLVMDYAANGALKQRHPKGTRLTLATILPYIQQVASALQFAHDHKLIHRDVKPENMLVGERDQVLLSDFGIAIVAQSSRYPRTQDVAGTLAYMAPEQIQSYPQPASDQYSLGIVIYEWLVGERPFTGTMQEVISKHLSVPPPPLHNTLPHLALGVEQVVLKALEKEPKERFASIQAFAAAFEQACQSDPSFISPSHQRLAPSLPLLFTDPPRQSSSPEGRLFSPAGTSLLSQPAAVNPLPDTIPVGPSGRPSASVQHDTFPLASPYPGTIPSPAGLLTPPLAPRKRNSGRKVLVVCLVLLVLVGGGLGVWRLTSLTLLTTQGGHPTTTTSPFPSATSQLPTATPQPAGIIHEFLVPNPNSAPDHITAGPDGNLWFTEFNNQSPKIGRMSLDGTTKEFSLSDTQGFLDAITRGPDGNVWFTEFNESKNTDEVGRITPDGTITRYPSSDSKYFPYDITTGPDKNLWFTSNGSIGRITPSGMITLFTLPNPKESPGYLTSGPDGDLWFTECIPSANGLTCPNSSIGRMTPTGAFQVFPLPNPNESLGDITTGPDGNLWFTECVFNANGITCNNGKIGRITPTGNLQEFPLSNSVSEPWGITAGPDGNLWFTEYVLTANGNTYTTTASQIGRITPTGKISEFPLSNPVSQPRGITTGPDSNLWFTENRTDEIGWITSGK